MSLIGLHFSSAPRHDGFRSYLAAAADAGSPFAAVFAVDQDITPDVRAVSPSTATIFRHQVKNRKGEGFDDATLGQGDPVLAGRNFFDACMPTFSQNQNFDFFCATNELNPKSPDMHRWANLYWFAQMQRADENHVKIVWGNFSAGNPEPEDFARYYADCLLYSAVSGHVLGLHEYGLDRGAMRHAGPREGVPFDLTLRYRVFYDAIINAGLPCPQFLISECAPGNHVDDNLESLRLDLEWYDAALMHDAANGIPIIAACLYQWGSVEAILFVNAMPTITQYVKTHPHVIDNGLASYRVKLPRQFADEWGRYAGVYLDPRGGVMVRE